MIPRRLRPNWSVARSLRPRTLRAKLTWGLVVLLAVSCATVGIAGVVAVNDYLTGQVDQQLAATGCRFPATLEQMSAAGHDPDSADDLHSAGGADAGRAGPEHADTRGQSAGTFGARVKGGKVLQEAVVRVGGATTVALDAADRAALLALRADGRAHTVDLSGLGSYRLYACSGHDSDTLITGLPLAPVNSTVGRLALVATIVFGAALVITGTAGALWVRRSLAPLRQLTATAAAVTDLRLDSGQVTLPEPAEPGDPDSETGRLAATLNRMLGHIQDALAKRHVSEERLRSFAADASHELRTPVASIRGHAELALRHPDPVPDKVERALQRIAAESARMSAIVDDLLLLARLDAGRPLERGPVDLTRLILDSTEDARAAGPGHTWALDLPDTPVTITADGQRLTQALANLLANARLHTPPGTTVTVRLQQPDQRCWALTVADTGPGVPEEIQPTLFERFTRADRRHSGGTSPTSGAGLGLAITSAIVEAHHGTLGVTSTAGETVFTLRLPSDRETPGPA